MTCYQILHCQHLLKLARGGGAAERGGFGRGGGGADGGAARSNGGPCAEQKNAGDELSLLFPKLQYVRGVLRFYQLSTFGRFVRMGSAISEEAAENAEHG